MEFFYINHECRAPGIIPDAGRYVQVSCTNTIFNNVTTFFNDDAVFIDHSNPIFNNENFYCCGFYLTDAKNSSFSIANNEMGKYAFYLSIGSIVLTIAIFLTQMCIRVNHHRSMMIQAQLYRDFRHLR